MDTNEIAPIHEVDEIIPLLEKCDLPTEDIHTNGEIEFYAIRERSKTLGAVGIEVNDDVALLRSVAVSLEYRGLSIGKKLVGFAETKAVSRGVRKIYMLTTTAQKFFEGLGYKVISRERAPEEIKNTRQFASICPSSAVFMVKEIGS